MAQRNSIATRSRADALHVSTPSVSEEAQLSAISGPSLLTANSVMRWRKLNFNGIGPAPRSGHVATVIGGKMIVFGGHSEPFLSPHIFIVDIGLLMLSVIHFLF